VTTQAAAATAHSAATDTRTTSLAGIAPLWAAALSLIAAPTVLAFFSGGYGVSSQLLTAAVLLVLLALVAIAAPWPLIPRGAPLAALAALGGYVLWTGLSMGWARIVADAAHDTDRVFMYAVAFALALVVLRPEAIRRIVPDALLAGIAIVCLYALAGRFLPDIAPQQIGSKAGSRLDQPITYWNAMGILAGFGVLLGVTIAGDPERRERARAVACVVAVVCGVTSFLTFSRGAWLAVLAGLVVCTLMRRDRATLVAAACVVGTTTALAVLMKAFPAVLSLEHGKSSQASQGAVFAPITAAAAVATGLGFRRLLRSRLGRGDLPVGRRLRTAAIVAVVPLTLLVSGVVASSAEQTTNIPTTAARLGSVKTNRGEIWSVALDTFARHPLVGIGSASFQVEWLKKQKTKGNARDAHSIYLETLCELGIVGGLLLAGFLTAVTLGLWRSARAAPRDPVLVAGAAVLAALAVHAGVDWDWEVPAVTLPGLILAAAVLLPRRAARPAP
jgi:hypothetical protein